jgi:hypothetical protein
MGIVSEPRGRGKDKDRLFTPDFVFTTLTNFANAFGMQMLVASRSCRALPVSDDSSRTRAGI